MRAIFAGLIACTVGRAAELPAQSRCGVDAPVRVGSDWEQYQRAAQVLDTGDTRPWTVRPFGPAMRAGVARSGLPWGSAPRGWRFACRRGTDFAIWPMRAQVFYNSAFPFGQNDGAVWAGRGLTLAADWGVTATRGRVTLTVAPLAFIAQNAPFRTEPSSFAGNAFADWRDGGYIDRPQRFGDGVYGALDAGESSLRVEADRITFGLSSAPQWWGPASDHPLILGNNAGGFPRVFVETARSIRIWRLGRAYGRMFWGGLAGSAYSALADSGKTRLASGVAAVFQPALMPELELGFARFFHIQKDRFALDWVDLVRPFGSVFKELASTPSENDVFENQLSSVFLRLRHPASGAEVYGEFGRDDRSFNLRDFLLSPDHESAYLVGVRKSWRASGGALSSLRAEVLNSRLSHLVYSRTQAPFYQHVPVREGHTYRGQVLGSAAADGGGASVLAYELYSGRGRTTVRWERLMIGERKTSGAQDVERNDVMHAWSASRLRFGSHADLEVGLGVVQEFNRHFRSDAFAIRATVSVTPHVRRASTN